MKADKIEYLDFAKGFAILTIVLFHFLQSVELPKYVSLATFFGGAGIHLFFFISGFGLRLSNPLSTKDFYVRRFSKVYIPYFITVTIIYILNRFIPLYADGNLNTYLSHVFLYKMFYKGLVNSLGGHFWFISTIISFYLFYPAIVWIRKKAGQNVFLLISVLITVIHLTIQMVFEIYERRYDSLFTHYFWEFGLGMVAAEKYKENGFKFWNFSLYWYIAIAVISIPLVVILPVYLGITGILINDLPACLGYISVSIIVYQIIWKHSSALKAFFLHLCTYSYSLYLIHMLVLQIALIIFGNLEQQFSLFYLVLLLPVCLFLSREYHRITSQVTDLALLRQLKKA